MPPVGSASRVNSSRPRRLVTFSKRERHDRNKRKSVIFVSRHDDLSDSGSDSGSDSDSDSDDDSEDEKLEDVKKDKQVKGSNNISESAAAGDSQEPGSAPSPPPLPDGTGVGDPPLDGTGVGDPPLDGTGVGDPPLNDTGVGDPPPNGTGAGGVGGVGGVDDAGAATTDTGTNTTSTTDSAPVASSNTGGDRENESTDEETSSTMSSSTSSSAASMTSSTAETSLGTSGIQPDGLSGVSSASVTSMYSGATLTTSLIPPSADTGSSPDSTKLAPSHSHPNAGAIAGGIIGGLVFLSLLVFGIFIILRRRKNRTAPSAEFLFVHPREYSPFSADSRFQRIGSPAPSFLSSSASSLAPHRGLGEPPPFTPGRIQYPFPEKVPLG